MRAAFRTIWLGASLISTSAAAQRFELKEPEVKRGEATVELENSAHVGLPDDVTGLDRTAHEVRFNYGLTDFWRLSPGLEIETRRTAIPASPQLLSKTFSS
jgi:hypothetical protein